jgi:tRNA (mo5U34)-methyltransferase
MVSMPELGELSVVSVNVALPDLPMGLAGWPMDLVQARFSSRHHGDYQSWSDALAALPQMHGAAVAYDDTVTISGEVDDEALRAALQRLHPWRKGPFCIGNVHVDSEWRSDWKWQRVASALGDLDGARVLDIGCGNGYFGWRMLGQGASEVIGIDPTLLFCMQHLAIANYTQDARNWVLPLKVEEIPATHRFDLVLSMGVIYHRRDAMAHTRQLADLLRPEGSVVLESLVVPGNTLVPQDRYARMRNVWCVPSVADLHDWLRHAGFVHIQTIDITTTSVQEQRSTPWMRFESLSAALDPNESGKTVEGYPAPMRAIVIARKPA